MDARVATVFAALLLSTAPASAQEAETTTTLTAAVAPNGDEVRLVTMIGGKAKATLQLGKAKPTELAIGDSVGAIEVAHGTVVIALAITDDKSRSASTSATRSPRSRGPQSATTCRSRWR